MVSGTLLGGDATLLAALALIGWSYAGARTSQGLAVPATIVLFVGVSLLSAVESSGRKARRGARRVCEPIIEG